MTERVPNPLECFASAPPRVENGPPGEHRGIQCRQPASLGQCSAGIVVQYQESGTPAIVQYADPDQCALKAVTKRKDRPTNYEAAVKKRGK